MRIRANRSPRPLSILFTGLLLALPAAARTVRTFAASTGSVDGVRCMAFQNKDGGMVAQLLNSRKQPAKLDLEWRGGLLRLGLPALSISTYLWRPAKGAAASPPIRGAR